LILSLERLVHRLLDHKDFSHIVDAVPARSVSAFHDRVRSSSQQGLSIPRRRPANSGRGSPSAKTPNGPTATTPTHGLWGMVPSLWGHHPVAPSAATATPAGAPATFRDAATPHTRRVGLPAALVFGPNGGHLRGTPSGTDDHDRSSATSSMSSGSSVISGDGDSLISAIDSIHSTAPRQATSSQTKLRPLRLSSPPA
jgi:hypothetical protein